MKKKIHREPLTSDIIFKAVFGRDTPGCKRALIGLLNRILEWEEDPIVDLVYLNPFSMAELEGAKEIIMDILVETSRGEQIDIEMQIGTTRELMNRFLYYLSKLVVRGLEKGEDYGKLKKSIVIVILRDRYLPDSEPAHSCFVMKSRETGYDLSELAQLHVLELGKYRWEEKEAEEMSPLEALSAYLSCTGDPEKEAYVEKLVGKGDEVIAMADEELKKVSEDDRLFAYRMSKEMYQMDQAIRMRTAKEEGLAEGLEKGRTRGFAEGLEKGRTRGLAEGMEQGMNRGMEKGIAQGMERGRSEERMELARKLKQKKMPMDEIMELTGLAPEDIEKL